MLLSQGSLRRSKRTTIDSVSRCHEPRIPPPLIAASNSSPLPVSHPSPSSWAPEAFAQLSSGGISKITPHAEESSAQEHVRLPPPPCQSDSPKLSAHGIYVPLPPCAFQPPPRQVLTKKEEGEDPFLAAYRECTRSRKQGTAATERKRDVWAVLERFGLGLSCRSSSGVREGAILRLKEQKKGSCQLQGEELHLLIPCNTSLFLDTKYRQQLHLQGVVIM